MRFLFGLLSIFYVAGIFLFADSTLASDLAPLNPYSLLHIPVYGILAVLLVFSCLPMKQIAENPANAKKYLLLSGLIALGIAIADETHQAYLPGRFASVSDVFLDVLGISLVLFGIHRFLVRRKRQGRNALKESRGPQSPSRS